MIFRESALGWNGSDNIVSTMWVKKRAQVVSGSIRKCRCRAFWQHDWFQSETGRVQVQWQYVVVEIFQTLYIFILFRMSFIHVRHYNCSESWVYLIKSCIGFDFVLVSVMNFCWGLVAYHLQVCCRSLGWEPMENELEGDKWYSFMGVPEYPNWQ